MAQSRRYNDIATARYVAAIARFLVTPSILLAIAYMIWGLEKTLDQYAADIQFNRLSIEAVALSMTEITALIEKTDSAHDRQDEELLRLIREHNREANQWKYEIIKNTQFRETFRVNGP